MGFLQKIQEFFAPLVLTIFLPLLLIIDVIVDSILVFYGVLSWLDDSCYPYWANYLFTRKTCQCYVREIRDLVKLFIRKPPEDA